MLVLYIYNVIGGIDDSTNVLLLHINMWFDIELFNLLLLSYILKLEVKNSTTTLTLPSHAKR
jgi:hypothetical protein